MAENQFAHQVFLSHSNVDDALASDVKTLLEANGVSVFTTPTSIPTGKWEDQIEEALRGSQTIWVMLTPAALRRSIWAHHEFGYFYGYNHGQGRDKRGDRCRYLFTAGAARPGLYDVLQGTEVPGFDDPTVVARVIAESLGHTFAVPGDWEARTYAHEVDPTSHPRIDRVGVASEPPAPGEGAMVYRLSVERTYIDQPIFRVDVLAAHPDVEVVDVRTKDVISPALPGGVAFTLVYRTSHESALPTKGIDSQGRQFSLERGRHGSPDAYPLLLTFETEDGQPMAAVFYFTASPHSKGFPELQLRPPAPMEWRQGNWA